MSRRYTLAPVRGLDRDALVRALCKLDLGSLADRWRAVLVCQQAMALASPGESKDWLWAYGLHLAIAGHELPVSIGPSDVIAEGYEIGRGLLPAGMPLVLELPLGQRRAIGSQSPGRSWLN